MGEDDDGPTHPRLSQLFAFGDGRNAKAPRIQPLQRPCDWNRAQTVGIRLDHGQKRHAGSRRVGGSILQERAEVDIDPGARVQSVH